MNICSVQLLLRFGKYSAHPQKDAVFLCTLVRTMWIAFAAQLEKRKNMTNISYARFEMPFFSCSRFSIFRALIEPVFTPGMTSSEASPQQKPKQNRNSGLWAAATPAAISSSSLDLQQQQMVQQQTTSASEANVVKLREKSVGESRKEIMSYGNNERYNEVDFRPIKRFWLAEVESTKLPQIP